MNFQNNAVARAPGQMPALSPITAALRKRSPSKAFARATKPIEAVEAGDLVWAWDAAGGTLSKRRVTRIFRGISKPVLRLTICGADERPETIETTVEHPIWVLQRGWVPARDVRPGDKLLSIGSGQTIAVQSVSEPVRTCKVFNFEVDALHNYFVARSGILVHNQSWLDAGKSRVRAWWADNIRMPATSIAAIAAMEVVGIAEGKVGLSKGVIKEAYKNSQAGVIAAERSAYARRQRQAAGSGAGPDPRLAEPIPVPVRPLFSTVHRPTVEAIRLRMPAS